MSSYIPLGIRTSYSLLDSTIKVSELQEQKFESIGIVDNHNLFGAMEYNHKLMQNHIKPITGCALNLEEKYQILLYCKSEEGYKNLCKLISKSYHEKVQSVYWHDFKDIKEVMAIAIPGQTCELDNIEQCAQNMEKYFGKNWAVGIRNRNTDEYDACYMSNVFQTPIVAIPEIRCITKEQNKAYHALTCIKNGTYFDDQYNQEFQLPSSEEMSEMYSDWPAPLENTFLFAQKCSFLLKKRKPELPNFPISDTTEKEFLRDKAYNGLLEKIDNPDQIYKDRLEFELSVISKMGFDGYFLIVADFINWSKNNHISVGPGRGSGAGSLVAYCIGITEIDPLKFGLVFERFLNPGRVSMPDFDVDFCPKGRNKVVQYITEKYGADNVAHIITFGSLQSKGVLRDVGRILQIPYPVVDKYSKAIPVIQGTNLSLTKYIESNPEIKNDIENDEKIKKMFEISLQIEGLPRHASIHAAGIVIGKEKLYNILPLYKENNLTVTQFSLNHIEDAGLVKFDLLGLTALTIISDIVKLIQQKDNNFNINNIPINDEKTLDVFRNGHTIGIFQFESKGMTEAVVGLNPENFEDLIAVISLYRPGPMENIPLFIKRKHGILPIDYLFPEMENTLKSTYGILVYQEQVLEIARNLAGYSMQEADLLRRAIGKKKPEEMKKHKSEFTKRICEKMNSDQEKAIQLFEQIESFARYAFVKAHATPYALIGYQAAYLKAHYPIEFIVSSMILEQNNTDKLAEFIYEGRRLNIETMIPDINKSEELFFIENGKIRFGLSAIKNVGIHCIQDILQKRPFKSIDDFFKRTNVNKKSMENLIKAGAFDSLEPNRALVLHKSKENNIPTLFQEEVPNWDYDTKINHEYEAFGFYLTAHPLSRLDVKKFGMQWISTRSSAEGSVAGFGKLEKVISKKSPNGDTYYVCIMSDPFGIWRFISRDPNLNQYLNKKIHIKGEDKAKFIISNSIISIDDFLANIEQIIFYIKDENDLKNLHKKLQIDENAKTKIMLKFENEVPLVVGKMLISEDILHNFTDFNWTI